MCGEEKAVETPGLYARVLLSRKGCISRKDRGKENTGKIEDQTCCKSEGGYPERDDGGWPGAAGAGSKWVAVHGHPRQSIHSISLRLFAHQRGCTFFLVHCLSHQFQGYFVWGCRSGLCFG